MKSSQLNIRSLRFTAKDFKKLPESDQTLAYFLGHIANEVNILQRLIMMAHNLDDNPENPEIQGRTAQTMCLLRVLVGKLNEAYKTIRDKYANNGLHSTLNSELDEHAVDAMNQFMTYLKDKSNKMHILRNKSSFHNDWEFATKGLESLPDDAALFVHTDGKSINTLFHFADLGAAFAMTHCVTPSDFEKGLDAITDEAIELANHLICFSTSCLGVLLRRHHVPMTEDHVQVCTAYRAAEARIPFFIDYS